MKTLLTMMLLLAVCAAQQNNSLLKRQSMDNYQSTRNARLLDNLNEEMQYNQPYIQGGVPQTGGEQNARSYMMNDSTLVLNANVLHNVMAEQYVAIFALVQVGPDLPTTNGLMAGRIAAFRAGLSKLGIGPDQVFVDMIGIEPKFETTIERKLFSKSAVEVPAGFELAQNVHVLYHSDSLLGKIVNAAVDAEIYDLVKVDYAVQNIDSVYSQMRKSCVEVLQEKRKTFEKLGVDLDTTYIILAQDNFGSHYPIDRYLDYLAYSRTSLDVLKGKTELKAERNRTQFYHRLSYNGYDRVDRATLLAPAVQFTYSMQVKYVIRKRTFGSGAVRTMPMGIKVEDGVKVIVPASQVR